VNGRGTLLTTEECYLDPKIQVRNPGMTRAQYNETFQKYLGVKNPLWLLKGPPATTRTATLTTSAVS
jgi:agmatine deiminase